MKKLLFFFAALIMSVASAVAENINSLSQVEAEALYTLSCSRGYITVNKDYTKLYGSNEKTNNVSNAAETIFDAEKAAFQFKFVKDGDNYYLYNMLAEKYSDADGNLVDEMSAAAPIFFRTWTDGTVQPYWNAEGANKNLNLGGSSQIAIGDWKLKDDGDSFTITKLEVFEYTVVVEGGVENGGVSYKGTTYVAGEKFTAATANVATATGVAVDGYSLKSVTVDNDAKTITVVYGELFPNPAKQYIIGNAAGDKNLYIVLAPGDDSQGDSSNATQASFAVKAGATPFTFTPSGNGFIISTDDEGTTKYLGANGGWNVGTTQQTVWTLVKQEEGVYALNRGGSNNLGSDNLAAGKGLYTDKPVSKNGRWFLEEYVAPAESHKVLVYLDGAAEGQKMQPGEDGEYVATLIGLTAGDHSVSVAYDSEAPVSANFSSTEKNDKITVHYKDGKITFENDVVTIEIGATGYATLYSDRDLNFAYTGVEAYVLTADNPEHLTAERVETAKACTGLVLKGAANTKYEFLHLTNDQTATSVLTGVLVDTPATGNELVLGVNADVVGFYKFTGTTLAAGKAYYVLPTAGSVARVLVDFDGTLTSIDFNAIAAPATSEIFDLQGRRVMNAQKGLFIMNGKKVIR